MDFFFAKNWAYLPILIGLLWVFWLKRFEEDKNKKEGANTLENMG